MAMVGEISKRLRQNDELAIEDLRLRASELADAYQQLAEQELARQEFLSNIAHELRTPLMIASGYLHALKKGMLSGEQLKTSVDTISRSVDQIVTLTNDILFLQEIELVMPEFQPVDIVEVANNVVKKFENKAQEKRINIKLRDDRNIPNVQGDSQSLERAVTALIDNAIKFSAPNSVVEVRFTSQENKVGVSVEDHGIGIDPTLRPRIFDRFVHLERSGDELFGGLGIGLSIARQVIQQHKGSLDVESQLGKGSKFTITLLKWL
jgi:signal transduction histidine kinase